MNIYIVGTSGAGKSSLARALAKKKNLRYVELDDLHFLPGWIERPDEDFVVDVEKAIQQDNWVVCGNYGIVTKSIMEKADQIIWLDYPFWMVFWRVFKRTIRRIITREPCCNGNYETFYQQFFTKYSIFWWVITTHRKRHRNYLRLMQESEYGDKFIRLQSPRDTNLKIIQS